MNLNQLKALLGALEVGWSSHEREDCLWIAAEAERCRFSLGARLEADTLTLACRLSDGSHSLERRDALEHVLLLNDDLTVFRIYSDPQGELWLSGEWPTACLDRAGLEWFLFDCIGFYDDLFPLFRAESLPSGG